MVQESEKIHKKPLTLEEVQRTVDKWIKEIGRGYFPELTNMVLLTEEVGELARVIARVYGQQRAKPGDLSDSPKKQLAEELADVMWVLVCLANQTGTDLTAAFSDTMAKKSCRDATRFL